MSGNSRKITRRKFLGTVAGGLAGLTALPLISENLYAGKFVGRKLHKVSEDKLRKVFDYDKVIRSVCSANCTQACGWNAFVKGDKYIVEIAPAGDYDTYDKVLGKYYNPRGCLRGASYLRYVYGDMRLKHPLIRVGKRGEGKFRRATWDEAISLISKKLTDISRKHGSDEVVFFSAIPAYSYVSAGAGYRLCKIMGASGPLSFYDWYCDLPPGEPMTWAVQTEESEEADWKNAKLLIFWGANVAESRLAAAHLLQESKYRGTKIYTIMTDYNATARMGDVFISPKPGTDAAFANGVINYLISSHSFDHEYVKTFTDLPFIIRKDNGKFLTEADVKSGGNAFKLFVYDNNSMMIVNPPGTLGDNRDTLNLKKYNIDPSLFYEGEITLKNGMKVQVETVFNKLKKEVSKFTPGKVFQITGIGEATLKEFALDLVSKKPAMIIGGGGVNHWFNNDINNRSMILMLALTGNVGKTGSGFSQYTGQYKVWLSGLGKYGMILKARPQNATLFVWSHYDAELYKLGKTYPEIVKDIESGKLKRLPNGLPVSANKDDGWAYNYYLLIKSLAKKWIPVYPKPPKKPRAMIIWRSNFLNQGKGGYNTLKWFKDPEKLEFLLTIDFRINSTALFCDVVLPAATWYEKFDVETTPMHVYLQAFNPVIKPLYESKTDYEIFKLIAKGIQNYSHKLVATGRWDGKWKDTEKKQTIDFTKVYSVFTANGKMDTDVKSAKFILTKSPIIYPNPDEYKAHKNNYAPELQQIIENKLFKGDVKGYIDGIVKLVRKAPVPFPAAQSRRPLTPFVENVEGLLPWPGGGKLAKEKITIGGKVKVPKFFGKKYLGMIGAKTLTGRQQFYIDHSYFLDLRNELPIYKEPEFDRLPDKKTKAPLKLNTPHGRWGTHSTFRDVDILLRLQRGETIALMSKADALKRGINDGDKIKIFNEFGEMICRAKVMAGIKEGEVRVANGAEMFTTIKGWFNGITPIRPKPTQSVKYPETKAPSYHLKYGWNFWGVTGNECDTSVEIKKIM
jgi:complex iron-sulfur molybdoenzyme family reductase subunit alpha